MDRQANNTDKRESMKGLIQSVDCIINSISSLEVKQDLKTVSAFAISKTVIILQNSDDITHISYSAHDLSDSLRNEISQKVLP